MTAPALPAVMTVTLNPAIDQTITLDRLAVGHVQRAKTVQHNAGGKGINVAGCLADWGVPVAAAGFLGADNQAAFAAFMTAKGIADHFVRVPGETRTNIKIADLSAGDTTDINLPGPAVTAPAWAMLIKSLTQTVRTGDLVVLGGSLPPGLPETAYADLCAVLSAAGARVVLDTSGAPLTAALAASGPKPWCIKPNRAELEGWAGRPLPDRAALLAAAADLLGLGLGRVVISLGAEGALFVEAGQAVQVRLPPVQAVSTVGAGDAMVAGLTAAALADAPLDRAARLAAAFACAKLAQVGPHLPARSVVEDLAATAETIVLR